MSLRPLAFAGLLALLLAPAALALPGAILVGSNGSTAVGPTVAAGGTVTVVVSGVYAYSTTGLADCRHYTYPDPTSWYAGGRMLWFNDGTGPRAFPCGAYSSTHTYVVEVPGQGAPLRFWINDSNYNDNAGGLVIAFD